MNMKTIRKAIELFKNEHVSKELQRANQRAWLCAMKQLGDKHVLAKPVKRIPQSRPVLWSNTNPA